MATKNAQQRAVMTAKEERARDAAKILRPMLRRAAR